MPKTILNLLLGVIVLIATQACIPQVPTTSDPDALQTAVAQTLAAAQTQTSQPGIPVTGDETPTPTVSVAVPTPSPARSPTALVIPTSAVPQVSVSLATNCRVGPGTAYERVGALLVGEVAEVVGRHTSSNYWVIRNPDRPGELCWLWGGYATVTGNAGALPELTPPPSPTPTLGFDASLDELESCTDTGTWWLDIALENSGGITFRSFFMTVTDTVTGTALSQYQDNFIDRDGCTIAEDQGDLDPEDTLIVSSPNFNYDPTGHQIRTRITVCSDLGQNGTCVTQSFNFTP